MTLFFPLVPSLAFDYNVIAEVDEAQCKKMTVPRKPQCEVWGVGFKNVAPSLKDVLYLEDAVYDFSAPSRVALDDYRRPL